MSSKPIWDYHSQSWWTPPDDPELPAADKIALIALFMLFLIAFILSR